MDSEKEALPPIPADEELEGMLDQPVRDLAEAHGIEYVDRASAIDALKAKRDAEPMTADEAADLVDEDEEGADEDDEGFEHTDEGAEPAVAEDPVEIPSDEELEALDDSAVKDLAVRYGLPYVDRADAIQKLKEKRFALNGQPNPV